jgi:protein SCO1/2
MSNWTRALYFCGPQRSSRHGPKDFKVFYKRVDGKTPGSYSMDHTAESAVTCLKAAM